MPGRFVAFEGIDGCGKSTQAARVAAAHHAVLTREPGGTPLGARLREILLHGDVTMAPVAEALVVAADRAQHLAEVIAPALDRGDDVVCDRYVGSTLAYQGYGRGVDLDGLGTVLEFATGGRVPDLTVLLDCPVEVGVQRRGGPRARLDRFEDTGDDFLERVRAGYLELAARLPNWAVVDAAAPLAVVADAVDDVLGALSW